jgi:hypothetical protein
MAMCGRWQRRWSAPGLLIAALAAAGCGPGHGMTLGRVQGKVSFKGAPLTYGTVSFVPDTSKGTDGPIATGTIQKDGSYILSTDEGGDGALVGHHKVSIVGLDPTPVNKTDEKPLPTPEESPLEFLKSRAKGAQRARAPSRKAEATAATPAPAETFVDRGGRTYRYVIPKKLGVAEESGLTVDVARGSNIINFDIAEDGTARVGK